MLLSKLIICIYLIFSFFLHPLHITFTNIEYVDKDDIFKITIKIFKDDFENLIEKKYGIHAKLKENEDISDDEKIFIEYINENFSMIFDGKRRKKENIYFVKKTINEDAVWFYFECEKPKSDNTLTVTNSILMDLFNDQTNLIIVNYKNFNKGYKIKTNNQEITIDL
ncbi:MAG: hypothetical protein KAT68_05240 [Bacteroidales bacterium]|nr:hypothetical protein [Bacteroidales bacterium]